MSDMNLTREDIALLFDAVERWEQRDGTGRMMSSMFGSILTKDDPEAKAKFNEEMERIQRQQDLEDRTKKERGVMLRAKLIALRDSMDAARLFEQSAS
ncbi:hypothetical protein [Schlesneria sp. DSM 10557]|uniref:hypothetical protein n=1 Tax=Schlesneria sp. DSM 10557 TaxID=3044399 RepID=UPI0035A18CB5